LLIRPDNFGYALRKRNLRFAAFDPAEAEKVRLNFLLNRMVVGSRRINAKAGIRFALVNAKRKSMATEEGVEMQEI